MASLLKLRFAPSPTGFLHVGGARTAIFNLLHARRYGGTFLLRIEDTDVERSKRHHAEQIVESLAWLGIEHDEGPIYQSDRLDRYRQRANELVTKGAAYRCFCTVEDLEMERDLAEKKSESYRYSGRCRDGIGGDSARPHVIRFRVEPREIVFVDRIRGEVRFDAALMDDFVLLRSDGNPTYHLSVVVDDIDMAITLVARGDDHLSNTPKHILLFEAFGADVPEFAHLPLILGSDRKRLSKRTGATSVEEFQNMGILPAALFNFLALLGWAPGSDREIITREDAEKVFDLTDVNRAPAIFDVDKLLWMNGQYMAAMSIDGLVDALEPFLDTSVVDPERLRQVLRLNQTRARTLRELADLIVPYFSGDDDIVYEEEPLRKHTKIDDLEGKMAQLRGRFAQLEVFDVATTEEALRRYATEVGLGAGKLIHPLRLALTGKGSSPPIFDVAYALGREKTLKRMDAFIARMPMLREAN